MTDSATARYGARQQSQGSNTNTWGDDKLNEVMRLLDRGSKGYAAYAMTGVSATDTFSWTNYVATNTGQVAVLKLTGSLSSAANLTVPSVEWHWDMIWNASGQTVTVKTAAGTGVAIANGQYMAVYCDGADCYNGSPTNLPGAVTVAGKISGVTAGTAATDAVNKTQMESAIATAGLPATAGTVLVSLNDSSAKYLAAAFESSGVFTSSIRTTGGSETIVNVVWDGGFIDGGLQSASFSAVAGRAYVAPTGGSIALATPTGSRRKIELALFGAGSTTLTGLIAGLSLVSVSGDQTITLTDASASRGWVMASSGSGGKDFSNPAEFLPYCAAVASLNVYDSGAVIRASDTTAFFTEMDRRGVQDTTNWTADTYKTLVSISSGKGLVAALVGPTAGGAEATTFRFTVDGVVSTVLVTGLASGERAVLMPMAAVGSDYTTAAVWPDAGAEALDADKATFGAIRTGSSIPPWRRISEFPMLKFGTSLLIEAKHSASITNSTATAYSAVMYRKFLSA